MTSEDSGVPWPPAWPPSGGSLGAPQRASWGPAPGAVEAEAVPLASPASPSLASLALGDLLAASVVCQRFLGHPLHDGIPH